MRKTLGLASTLAPLLRSRPPGERIDSLGRNLREMVHTPIKGTVFVDIKTANNHAFSQNSARVRGRRVTMCVQKVNPALYAATTHMRAICASLTRSKAISSAGSSRVWRCFLRAPASSSFRLVEPFYLPVWRWLLCALKAIAPPPHLRLVQTASQPAAAATPPPSRLAGPLRLSPSTRRTRCFSACRSSSCQVRASRWRQRCRQGGGRGRPLFCP